MSKKDEAVRAAWMAGYTEGERDAVEKQPAQQQERKTSYEELERIADDLQELCDKQAIRLGKLEAQQQEPVAYLTEDGDRVVTAKTYNSAKKDGGAMWSTMQPFCVPSYTSPQSKPWVGLTDDDIQQVRENCGITHHAIKTIEAKLREKNNG